jgi:hypothetical protein
VKSPENMYFSCLTSRRYFIKSPAGTHAYPPVLLDFEGDRLTVHEGVPPPQNAIFFARFVIFYKFFEGLMYFLRQSRLSGTTIRI